MTSVALPTAAITAPAGQASNFAAPNPMMRWDVLCATACLTITTILLGLRVYVRLAIHREWILEDYMCLVSWGGLIAYTVTMTVAFVDHGGVHEWDLAMPEVQRLYFLYNVTSIEYAPAILATKVTVLLLYRRVFRPQRGSMFDIATRTFMALLSLFYISTMLVKIWECVPRAKIWDKSLDGICVDAAIVLDVSGFFNTVSDVLILLIPLRAVYALQMKRKRKAGVMAIFTVGLIAPIFSIIGLVVRFQFSASPDNSYYNAVILLWAAAEISTGLCCVCLPLLPPLVRRAPQQQRVYALGNARGYSRQSKKQLRTMDDDWLVTHDGDVTPPKVVTDICAGGSIRQLGGGKSSAHNFSIDAIDEEIGTAKRSAGIMMTVGIEQTIEK